VTLTPDRLHEPDFDTVVEGRDLVSQLEADEAAFLRQLHERQVREVLGMVTPTSSPREVYSDLMAARMREMDYEQRARRQIEASYETRARRERQRLERERRGSYHSPYGDRDWYCYCSPTRGQYFERWGEEHVAAEDIRARNEAVYRQALQPVTLSEDELVHTCRPDANGVCVWANCPNTVQVRADEPGPLTDDELTVTYTTWLSDPEPEPSKELAVIPRPELEVIEVIPLPKKESFPTLLLSGVGASVLVALVACASIVGVLLH
jgi:hypothetical protein